MAPSSTLYGHYRLSVSKDRFSLLFPQLRTQTYHDPNARGPGNHTIRTIAWNPLGSLVATGAGDRTLRIWNPERPTAKHSTELRGHTMGIERVLFNPDRETELASCSADGTVRLWDVRSKTCIKRVDIGGEPFTMAWSEDGKHIIVGRTDDNLVTLDLQRPSATDLIETVVASPPIPQGVQTNHLLFSGPFLIVTLGNGCIKILHFPSLTQTHQFNAHTSSCYCIDYHPLGKYLAIGGTDSSISLWDTKDWYCKHTCNLGGSVRSVGFSFDGSYVCGGQDETSGIDIFHTETGESVCTIPTQYPPPIVAWHPHRYWLAYSGDPSGLRIVGAAGGQL